MGRRWQMTVEDSVVLRNGDLAVLGTYRGSISDEAAELLSPAGKVIRVEKVHAIYPSAGGRGNYISLTFAGVPRALVQPGTVIESID